MRPGVWKRAGIVGVFVGLDYTAAFTLAPRGVDQDDFAYFIACAEEGLMQAAEESKPDDGE